MTFDEHTTKSPRPPIDSHNTITSDAECEIVALNIFRNYGGARAAHFVGRRPAVFC